MSHVSLEIPDDLLVALREQPAEIAAEMRWLAAIHFLRLKRLSLGQAARLAGMNRIDFIDALAAQSVPAFDLAPGEGLAEVEAGRRGHEG